MRIGVTSPVNRTYHPADLFKPSTGVQPEPFDVQLPHQAVAARVSRVPRVELPPEGVGGYALPPLALSVWVQLRLSGTPRPTLIGFIVADVVEVPADHQLIVQDRHRLRRAGGVLLPAKLASGRLR